jgi:hypothetical protein
MEGNCWASQDTSWLVQLLRKTIFAEYYSISRVVISCKASLRSVPSWSESYLLSGRPVCLLLQVHTAQFFGSCLWFSCSCISSYGNSQLDAYRITAFMIVERMSRHMSQKFRFLFHHCVHCQLHIVLRFQNHTLAQGPILLNRILGVCLF